MSAAFVALTVADRKPIPPTLPLIAFVISVALLAPLRILLPPSAALAPWQPAQVAA